MKTFDGLRIYPLQRDLSPNNFVIKKDTRENVEDTKRGNQNP
jgi:hypothetical protein